MASLLDSAFARIGYTRMQPIAPVAPVTPQTVEKADEREGLAQNPLAMAYAAMNTQWGLRRPSRITLQTLRSMSRANWVDRTCIFTLPEPEKNASSN